MKATSDLPDPIAQLLFVGDQRTVCAIGADGSIPLMSFPDLDSPTIFSAALSGNARNAMAFETQPASEPVDRELIDGTNRLITRLRCGDSRWQVEDFMVPGDSVLLVRFVTATTGPLDVTMKATVKPDYEREGTKLESYGPRIMAASNTEGDVIFSAAFDLSKADGGIIGRIRLQEGETAWVIVGQEAHDTVDIDALRRRTDTFWQTFRTPSASDAPLTPFLQRQILSTGLLHNAANGSVAAAGTFGFPEAPHGERNWDYRFVWVRDSAIGAKSMARLGFTALARTWLRFVLLNNSSCDRSPLNLMLTMDGNVVDEESKLDHFHGMLGARPVRVGNEAAGQLQLDIFGELAFALRALCEAGERPDEAMLDRFAELLDWLADNWKTPDSSIWELRGEEKHYLFSRLMCWVAFRDAQVIFDTCDREPDPRWAELEDEIAANIRDEFWCDKTSSYMQTSDCSVVDAAVIAMRLYGFLERDDERWQQSKTEIRNQLVKPAGVLRYPHHADDGFDSNDGTFVLCTCWWIEVLWMDGETDEARTVYDDLLLRFPHGQASEEIGEDGRLLGNMPQLFSHAGLIEATLRLGETG